MDVQRYINNGYRNYIREVEAQYERNSYSYFDFDDDHGYRPAQSFPARPGQLRYEQLLQVTLGSILRVYHGNESTLWRLTGFAPQKFLVDRVLNGRWCREEKFYTDYCLLPYDTGVWNSANWVALEQSSDFRDVRPVGRPIKPPKREVMPRLDWRKFGF